MITRSLPSKVKVKVTDLTTLEDVETKEIEISELAKLEEKYPKKTYKILTTTTEVQLIGMSELDFRANGKVLSTTKL